MRGTPRSSWSPPAGMERPRSFLHGRGATSDLCLADSRGGRHQPAQLLASISRALEGTEPFVLVVDGGQALTKQASFEILTSLVERLPIGSRLALTSRKPARMPVGRLRAHRKVFELRCRDFAMPPSEVTCPTSNATGLDLAQPEVDTLVRRTGVATGGSTSRRCRFANRTI